MNALVVYEELSPILKGYARFLVLTVASKRARSRTRVENAQLIAAELVGAHQKLAVQIRQARIRIRNLQRGAALTEAFDDNDDSVLDNNLTDADRFLLKKAYRRAAAIAHPDKGGDSEAFTAVNEAYKAGDLNSLNEYFLLREAPSLATIAYLLDELTRVDVQWRKFCNTNEFLLAQLHQQGYRSKAQELAHDILVEHLNRLEDQERILLSPSFAKEYEL